MKRESGHTSLNSTAHSSYPSKEQQRPPSLRREAFSLRKTLREYSRGSLATLTSHDLENASLKRARRGLNDTIALLLPPTFVTVTLRRRFVETMASTNGCAFAGKLGEKKIIITVKLMPPPRMYVYTMARYSTAVPDETESRSEASNSLSYAAGGPILLVV